MKRLFIGVLIIILLMANVCFVRAYSGEIDPENYIILPTTIYIKDSVGTGSIILSSQADDYNISYQKIDITKEKYDVLTNTLEELREFITESNSKLNQEQEKVNSLKSEYEKLQSSDTATSEEITEAYTKYNTAYEEYKELFDSLNDEVENRKNSYYALIPDYTDSWQETTNTSNNVNIDFKNYSGNINFVLWVKITNGTNSYYDVGYYSTTVNNTQDSDDENSNTEEDNETWTDFSNAKISLVKDGISSANVEITGVTPNKDNFYYLYILNNNTKPEISELPENEGM